MIAPTRSGLPRVSRLRVGARALVWAGAAATSLARLGIAHLRGPVDAKTRGVVLRRLFEQAGGTAIKLGQQLAMRSDLLPQETCEELLALSDAVEPIPGAQVEAMLQAELRRPLAAVFSDIDLDPIGSASVACVYRATRVDGRRVALKLRRAGIRRAFAADLAVLGVAVRLAEAISLVRDGLFTHLLHDLDQVLSEETSLSTEARYQRAFRRELTRDRIRGVRAPEVHSDLCTDALLVSELVVAVPMTHLLQSTEAGDTEALAALAGRGITPQGVAQRLARFSMWVRFEASFFHADPHAGNLFVEDGGHLVLVDFGACGKTSSRTRRNHLEVLRHLADPEPTASAGIMLSDLSPLPRIDTERFRRQMEDRFSDLAVAMADKNAHWSDRIVVRVWLRTLEVARQHQVRVNLDTVRSTRAVLLYDTLSFRLDGRMGMSVIRRYLRQRTRRVARRPRAAEQHVHASPLETVERVITRVGQLKGARTQLEVLDRASVHIARGALWLTGALAALAGAAGMVALVDLEVPSWLAVGVGALALAALAVTVLQWTSRTLGLLDRAHLET